MRELLLMREARRLDQWLHTAQLMALLANCHRDQKKQRRPYSVRDFLPSDLQHHLPVARRGMTPEALRGLRSYFRKGT